MSTAALPHVSSPDDEDLANLYHQVLAGFAEESPTTEQTLRNGEGEIETLYSNYGDDGGDTPTSTRQQRLTVTPPVRSGASLLAYTRLFQIAHSTSGHIGLPPSPRPSVRPVSTAPSVQSPTLRGPRPLPRIPGQPPAMPTPPPPPPPVLYPMPEPRIPDDLPPPPLPPKRTSDP